MLNVNAIGNPTLFFRKSDVPQLQERARSPQHKEVWEKILKHAEEMCDPEARGYADPEKIDHGGSERIVVRAHTYGRRLTHWVEMLGFAYQLTGDARFGKHGARVLISAAQKLPVSDPRVAKSFAGARGDIMRGFAVGLDWLGEAMTDDQRRIVEEVAASHVRNILAEFDREKTWWKPYHNFIGVAIGSAGMLSLKLSDRFPDEAPHWTEKCAEGVRLWLDKGFDEQGAYYEGTTYTHYGLSNALRFADALLRSGGPDLFQAPNLRRVPEFYAQSMLPGETALEARNDANYGGLGDPLVLRLAQAYHSGLAKWLWERAGFGISPMRIIWHNNIQPTSPTEAGLPLAHHFVGRGLCVFRTGWETDDVMFAVEAGPYYKVTHNQADKGQFTLYGLGYRWAIDSGYGNTREPGGRAQTVAHNCILIDGQGQTLSGAGLGTNGKILAFENNERFGYALSDCTEAYNRNSSNTQGVGVKRAYRHTLFIRRRGRAPSYALVLDDIRRDKDEHEYTWLLHTNGDMEFGVKPSGALLKPQFTSGGAFVETPQGAEGKGECAWTLNITEQGRYAIWARVRAGGVEAGKSDSFFVQMDAGTVIAWHSGRSRTWSWQQVCDFKTGEPIPFPLQPGEHVLRFKTREPETQIDCVVVTCDPDAQPPFAAGVKGLSFEAECARISVPMTIIEENPPAAPPRMALWLHARAPVAIDVDSYDHHPRLKASTRSIAPDFAALLIPLLGEMPEPAVIFQERGSSLRIRVEWPDHVDQIDWPRTGNRRPHAAVIDGD